MFTRITIEPDKMGGLPCIRGMRMPVVTVVDMVVAGMTTEEILYDFPYLEEEDITEALDYDAASKADDSLLD